MIELDADTARAIAEHAAAMGLSVPEFLRQYFAAGTDPIVIDDVDRWLDALAENGEALTALPADFSTADIYADHD